MLCYDKIDVFEGFDINEKSASKQFDIGYYWYILDKGFKFHPNICNGCHDLLIMSINLNDIVIL